MEDFLHFFFFFGGLGWRIILLGVFLWGVTLSPPREPILSRACMHRPGLHLKKKLPAAPFSFFATQKKGSLSDSVV